MKIPNQNTRAKKQENETTEAEPKTAAKISRRRKTRPSRGDAAAPIAA